MVTCKVSLFSFLFGFLFLFLIYISLSKSINNILLLNDCIYRSDASKHEDSYTEVQQKYLANEAKRFEREQAWVQSLSKTRTPTHKQLSMSQMNSNNPNSPSLNKPTATPPELSNPSQNLESFLKSFNSCELNVQTDLTNVPTHKLNEPNSTPSSDILLSCHPSSNTRDTIINDTPTDLEMNQQNDDSSMAGQYSLHPDDVQSPPSLENKSQDSGKNKDQTVFRSLYLKASQVFPLSNSPSTKSAKHSQNGNHSELTPHPELSYHSIISHHSSRFDSNHENQGPVF